MGLGVPDAWDTLCLFVDGGSIRFHKPYATPFLLLDFSGTIWLGPCLAIWYIEPAPFEQDWLNQYFMANAERIRSDKDHTVLMVPKEGPASSEMVP